MKQSNRMLMILLVVTLLISGVVSANVFAVSVLQVHARSQTDLTDYVSANNMRRVVQSANRGYIFDRNGAIIAQDTTTYTLVAVTNKERESRKGEIAYVDNPLQTARILAPILNMEESEIYTMLTKEGAKQVELGTKGKNLSKEKKEEIEALDLNGIEFVQTSKRTYPLGSFASYLVGYALAGDDGSVVGKMGAEKYMNTALSGENGYKRYQADKYGYILPGMKVEEKSAVNGNNVYLTLDQSIQDAMESSMKQTTELFHPDKIWGTVMEIETGKILAWGQTPAFDPNEMEITEYVNYVSQMPYEPGSTMKVFTYAAAIDSGVYDGSTIVDSSRFCYGANNKIPFRVTENDSRRIGCIGNANGKSWGNIPYDLGLVYSSNVLTASIITNLITPEVYEEYLDRFGFFKLVDTDGIDEVNGYKNYTWPADKIALTYGQGSTVTMLQMLQAYSSIFNDGLMIKPYYIDQIRSSYDDQQVLYQGKTTEVGQPISSQTSKQVQQLMYDTANRDDGTAKYYNIPETKIIAKTGTTQLAAVGGGGYTTGKTIVSLVAALPADDPKVMVYYAFQGDYDRNAHLKSEPVQNILRRVAMTYGFTDQMKPSEETVPDESQPALPVQEYTMPQLTNHSVSYAQQKLSETECNVLILGNGSEVIDQYPKENELVVSRQKVFLLTDLYQVAMPDMTGWTRKDVASFWAVTNFAFKIDGYGKVVSQSIPPGTILNQDLSIEVKLE